MPGKAVAIAAVIHCRSQARDTRITVRENRTSHTVIPAQAGIYSSDRHQPSPV
jgi:hypothetical protein